MDEDVVRGVIGPVPGQVDPLASDLEGQALPEGVIWCRPPGVIVTAQQPPGLLVTDASDVPPKQGRGTGVVGVVMGIDEMRHLVADAAGGRNLVHGALDVVTDA